jgi:hypothetical protein
MMLQRLGFLCFDGVVSSIPCFLFQLNSRMTQDTHVYVSGCTFGEPFPVFRVTVAEVVGYLGMMSIMNIH